jgi:hypothetical protein
MDHTALVQAGRERALDGRAQPLATVGDDQQRSAEPAVFQVLQQPRQASVDSAAPGARPRNAGLPSVEMPQATSTGSALALGCILQERPVQVQVVEADPGQVAAAPGVELGP